MCDFIINSNNYLGNNDNESTTFNGHSVVASKSIKMTNTDVFKKF